MRPFDYEQNLRRQAEAEKLGYTFVITSDGYNVCKGDKFVGGASVKLSRSKPLHWRHRKENLKNNLQSALTYVKE